MLPTSSPSRAPWSPSRTPSTAGVWNAAKNGLRVFLPIVLSGLLLVTTSSGCGASRHASRAEQARPGGDVVTLGTSGDGAAPAAHREGQFAAEMQFPGAAEFDVIEYHPAAGDGWRMEGARMPAGATWRIQGDGRSLTTGTASPPPPPPRPQDQAAAQGVRIFWILGAVFALAAVVAVWRGYPVAAGACCVGAVAAPALATFLASQWAILAVAVCGALALGAACLWWFKLRHQSPAQDPRLWPAPTA